LNLPFTKMQGIGNDFIVVDGRETPALDWPALSPRLCDRRFGIGADGILLIESHPEADAAMRMFNPDGTEDFCGNGLRCVARYVVDGGRRTDLTIATLAGPRRAELHADGAVTVEMGEPRFTPAEIPLAHSSQPSIHDTQKSTLNPQILTIDGEPLEMFPLSTGTTHSILFIDELPDDERFFRLSRKIEHHPLFPERTSVMWTKLEGRDRLRLRIWERGVGETWGCGTGACAAAVAAKLRGFTGDEPVVASKGGELRITWPGEGAILMTGPAEYVFTGQIEV
jgi:diaminopimelate epimerase